MKGLVIFLLIVLGIVYFSFVAANMKSEDSGNKESKEFEFSTYTSAVCYNESDFINCRDEVFVNCNGNVSKAIDVAECNGIKVDILKATGFAVFEKEWQDPRN